MESYTGVVWLQVPLVNLFTYRGHLKVVGIPNTGPDLLILWEATELFITLNTYMVDICLLTTCEVCVMTSALEPVCGSRVQKKSVH